MALGSLDTFRFRHRGCRCRTRSPESIDFGEQGIASGLELCTLAFELRPFLVETRAFGACFSETQFLGFA